MSLHSLFSMDAAREEHGVAVCYTNFRVTLARAGGSNHQFNKEMDAAIRPHRVAMRRGAVPQEIMEEIDLRLYASAVVKNWETLVVQEDGSEKWVQGIEAENGDILPFTKENVYAVFKKYPEFYEDVKLQSNQIRLYRAAVQEDLEGN